ncbi:MAG: cytolethal distending toxin subunit B family protein [Helicobacteraceae bacterium]
MKKLYLFAMLLSFALAGIDDYKIATWNLQGSSASNESKWNISVRQIITGSNAADILALQEAGSLPTTARATGRSARTQSGLEVAEYEWQLGSVSRPQNVFIYFSQTDIGGNRVNLAIVSRQRADELIILPPPTTVSRPIIGIVIGNEAFMNIHALASGGGDSAAFINTVASHFSLRPNITWMVMGDFNANPERVRVNLDLSIRSRVEILAPPSSTQRSGGVLDWAVVGNQRGRVTTALAAVLMLANARTHIVSDHFPVNFRRF